MTKLNPISLKVSNVCKTYERKSHLVEVLRGVSFELNQGDVLALTGPSGSGKSTLLQLIGTLDPPTEGVIEINGANPFELPEAQLSRFRNCSIGFVFQDHHLLPQYSVLENVLIPALAFKQGLPGAQIRARMLLDRVGLSRRLTHRPHELSGGECQRVAVARALINQPSLLLCDEPTGNLDHSTADNIASLLFELHTNENNILIVVTHSLELANRFQRRFELVDGLVS